MQSQSIHATTSGIVAAIFVAPAAAAPALPTEARTLIQRVHSAAADKDIVTLQSLMGKDFTWSFGGDGDSNQAIAAWRQDPRYLRNLSRVSGQRCAYMDKEYVQCPPNAGMAFRAGFKRLPEGWRMVYFVAGD